MDSMLRDYIRHANRCHVLAHAAPTEAIRVFLRRIARQYEREAGLAQRAFQCVVEQRTYRQGRVPVEPTFNERAGGASLCARRSMMRLCQTKMELVWYFSL